MRGDGWHVLAEEVESSRLSNPVKELWRLRPLPIALRNQVASKGLYPHKNGTI